LNNVVIFDLDGTILDSKDGILSSLEYALKRNAPEYLPFLNESIIGPPIKKILEAFVKDPQIITLLSKEFRFHYDSIGCLETKLFEGVYDGLKHMPKSSLYVSTNKPKKVTSKILEKLKIENFFNKVLSLNSLPYIDKTEIVRTIKINNNSKKIIVVGDSLDDYLSAEKNNCEFIFCEYGYGSYPINASNLKIVKSSIELMALIKMS
jgi:phosphoglycolate phosphatase